jgi:hypothetical protein
MPSKRSQGDLRLNAADYQEELNECRNRLARALRVEDVPDAVWGYVIRLDLVYPAIMGDDKGSWDELVAEARAKYRESLEGAGWALPPGRGTGEGARGVPHEIEIKPSESARKRAEAFAEVAVTLAENHPEVQSFRRMHLRGQLLTGEEARAFLDRRCGGPRLPARHFKIGSRKLSDGHLNQKMADKAISVRLWKLAERLSNTYRWRTGDAINFVLTGDGPHIEPITVGGDISQPLLFPEVRTDLDLSKGIITAKIGDFSRPYRPSTARITISAEVWVDAGEVAQVFRKVQRQILGGDAKPPAEKTLESVKFTARRMREHPEETWEERLLAWNQTCVEGWRKRNFRALRQAFERFTYRPLNFPSWRSRDES